MSDLVEKLERLRQWHLKSGVNRVNKNKRERHYESAEILALAYFRIEELEDQLQSAVEREVYLERTIEQREVYIDQICRIPIED